MQLLVLNATGENPLGICGSKRLFVHSCSSPALCNENLLMLIEKYSLTIFSRHEQHSISNAHGAHHT